MTREQFKELMDAARRAAREDLWTRGTPSGSVDPAHRREVSGLSSSIISLACCFESR